MKQLLLAVVFAASLATVGSTTAQVYSSRPITMIVPFPAGGSVDAVGRIVAEGMRVSLGQTVVVENVAGAAGSIGVGRVARAAADGYTLSMGQWGTHVANGAIYALPYDVLRDFEPLALIASNPYLVLTKNSGKRP
jgi:tripartite-type tricarboxylate transporter receptor subunit TctC